MKFYLHEVETVYEHLQSSAMGLSAAEAESRLAADGKNKLREGKRVSLLKRFIDQLVNPMILVLIGAAVLSAIASIYSGHDSLADVFIIMFVVVLNSVLGVVQESKAERAIEALKAMAAATSKVLRDGQLQVIKSEDLVKGDIIMLEAGDAVPADARLIECASIKSEEAPLTGESVPVDKTVEPLAGDKDADDIPLGDRYNCVYMGSTIVYGRGKAIITAVGMDTEMGKIAEAITQAADELTPLQIKLNQLSKILTILVLGICAFIFAFSVIRSHDFTSEVMLDTFMLAVSLAVAAIPEGLAAVVTIVLSIGVTRMSKNNAVIRRLTAVETLGCTQVICSDKTGTLTQNKMTVVEHYADDVNKLALAMTLCNDAQAQNSKPALGEPTEAALVNFATSLGIIQSEAIAGNPRKGEAPFDSARKMMSTVHETASGYMQYTKGAPDELLHKCTHYLRNGEAKPLDDAARENILTINKGFAGRALRVLGAACRPLSALPDSLSPESLEHDMIFLGLVGMIDPVRPEVLAAIEQCKTAGIRPVMITGDHRDTAAAIAMELGIISDPSETITGVELNRVSDEDLVRDIAKYKVFARVQPDHKVRIVNAWKQNNVITAMTGDGVNDAPAIKNADIGVGMGITGTDVTKNVADMVLTDDNFATIVSAVEEGRRIYDNIRKTTQFLLGSNLSEVVAIFIATLFGFIILRPVHILWINLITDSLPALALGMEKGEPDLMLRQPRRADEGIFAAGVGSGVLYQGLTVAILTLTAYFIGHYIESGVWELAQSADGITMAFLTMSMAEIFHSFNLRSQYNSIFTLNGHNKYLYGSMIVSMILTASVIYIQPLANAFGFEHINLTEYLIAMALAIFVIPVVETVKYFQRIYLKHRGITY